MKVLVQRCDRLGDTILSLPLIDALKKYYPDSKIDFLTSSTGAEVAKLNPNINEIIIAPKENSGLINFLKFVIFCPFLFFNSPFGMTFFNSSSE